MVFWLRARTAVVALAAGALFAACSSVDLGDAPADVNGCRPSQQFFIDEIWPNVIDKDYGGRRCADGSCHSEGSGRPLSLKMAEAVSPVPIPLPANWAANYRSVTEQMECTNVSSSPLLLNPTEQVTHGGRKLFEPTSPEATLIQMWVTAP